MSKFNVKEPHIETASALGSILQARTPRTYPAYIGLDVHKESIAVAVARMGRAVPEFHGEIANKPKAVAKLVKRLSQEFNGEVLLFCYEAGPCGYVLYRQLLELGQDCQVVAPSLIPKKPGDRVKTDRRDAVNLARSLRSADLSAVWVPDEEQEAMRDLTRARGDMKAQEGKARQQLNADLMAQMERVLPQWSLGPVVHSLVALRGIDKLAAMVLLAELGDISRFDSPPQLMAFLGLVPSEHSSGRHRRQGAITKTGNGHARRMLVESAWSYRFPARQTMHLKRKAQNASDEAKGIAWKAQKRLCGRYKTLTQAGKNTKLVCVAIARELAGFIWDIVCHEMPKVQRQHNPG